MLILFGSSINFCESDDCQYVYVYIYTVLYSMCVYIYTVYMCVYIYIGSPRQQHIQPSDH